MVPPCLLSIVVVYIAKVSLLQNCHFLQLSFNETAKFTLFVPVSFLNIPTEPVILVSEFSYCLSLVLEPRCVFFFFCGF